MASGEFDLRQLQILLTVSLTGSYTAAAETLGYTQPAVSYQMRKLQDEVGTPLVVRAGRGLVLTEAGRSLAQHAKKIFASVRTARDEIGTLAARGNALVRVAVFQSCCATLLPATLTRLARTSQSIRLSLDQAEPDRARTLVRSGEVDLGLLCTWANESLPDGEESMLRVPLMTDRRCAVVRRDHPLASQSEIALGDLAEEYWVMEKARDRFVTACAAAGFAPKIAATADDHITLQNLVAAGLGVTLMTELALTAYLDPRLVARPLRNWPLRNTYALLWPNMVQVPAVAAVLKAVRMGARDVSIGPHSDLTDLGCRRRAPDG